MSLEEAPGARPRGGMAQAPALQEAPRPVVLALAGERFHHRRLDERFRQAARGEVGRDLEAARAARAQRPRPLARVGRVAHPAELAAARDGGGRGLVPVAEADQARLEVRLRARPPREQPRGHVEGRGDARRAARSGRP